MDHYTKYSKCKLLSVRSAYHNRGLGISLPTPPHKLKILDNSISLLDFCLGFRRDPVSPLCCARVCVLHALWRSAGPFFPHSHPHDFHSGMMQPTDISSKKTTLGAFYCTTDEVVRGNWDLSHFQHVKCKSFFSVKSVAFRLGSSQTSRLPPHPQ